MRINKINYEQYALDYLEGSLDGALLVEMEAFLAQHPSIREELEEMRLIILSPDEGVLYEGKEDLMRPTRKVFPLWWGTGMAAVAATLLAVWMFWGGMVDAEVTPKTESAENPVIERKKNEQPQTPPNIEIVNAPTPENKQTQNPETTPKSDNPEPNNSQNIAPSKPATMRPHRPEPIARPQNSTSPKTPVAKQPTPRKDDRPIALTPQPQKPNDQSTSPEEQLPKTTARQGDWVDVAPIGQEVAAVASSEKPKEELVKLKPPTMTPPAPSEEPVASNGRSSKLRDFGLLPEKSNQSRFGGLRKALVPEGFTEK